MIDTLTLHGGPADGTIYRLNEGDQPAEELQLTVRLPIPEGRIEDLPRAVVRGEVRAVYHYRHTGDGNYQYQEPK